MGLKFFFIHWHGVALRASQHKVALEIFFLKKRGNSIDLFEILFLKNNWRPMKLI